MNDLLFIGNISFDKITNLNGQFKKVVGGSAFNSAYCARQVSEIKIGVYSVVGNDFPLRILQKNQINFEGLQIIEEPSNTFLIDEKAETVLFEKDPLVLNLIQKIETKHLHVSCRKGINNCLNYLKNISHTSSSIDVYYTSLEEKFEDIISCISSTEILFLNKMEYEMLSKMLGSQLNILFPQLLIIKTEDEKGIEIMKNNHQKHFGAIRREENVVSSTGAGDSFIGGFLGAYCSAQPISSCLAFGIASATLSIQGFGVDHSVNSSSNVKKLHEELMTKNVIDELEF